jgi:competence protein ComEC
MPKHRIFLFLCLAFLVGVFLGRFRFVTGISLIAASAFFVAVITLGWPFSKVYLEQSREARSKWNRVIAGFVGLAAVAGAFRYQMSFPTIDENHLASRNGSPVSFQAYVSEEPDVRESTQQLTLDGIRLQGRSEIRLGGKVLVTAGKYKEYQYGEVLAVRGMLDEPFESEGFSYKNFLARDGIYSVMRFPEIEKIGEGEGSKVKAGILSLKQAFSRTIESVLPSPQSGFLLGLLLGTRHAMPEELLEQFRIAGILHIVAISGYNISLIGDVLRRLLQRFMRRNLAFLLAALGIIGFVLLTGGQASVVRAGIMGLLVLLALHVGRVYFPTNALAFTGAAMVAHNPKILHFDVGFLLSFAATVGVLLAAQWLERRRWQWDIFRIGEAGVVTVSAQAFTLPILLASFGTLSILALPANILVLPVIPAAMFFGFASGILGIIFLPLGQLVGYLVWVLLTYIIRVADVITSLPFSQIEIANFSWMLAGVCYALLLGGIAWYKRKV